MSNLVHEKINAVIKESLDTGDLKLDASTSLRSFGVDSIEMAEILSNTQRELSQELGLVELELAKFVALSTIGDVYNYVEECIKKNEG